MLVLYLRLLPMMSKYRLTNNQPVHHPDHRALAGPQLVYVLHSRVGFLESGFAAEMPAAVALVFECRIADCHGHVDCVLAYARVGEVEVAEEA